MVNFCIDFEFCRIEISFFVIDIERKGLKKKKNLLSRDKKSILRLPPSSLSLIDFFFSAINGESSAL